MTAPKGVNSNVRINFDEGGGSSTSISYTSTPITTTHAKGRRLIQTHLDKEANIVTTPSPATLKRPSNESDDEDELLGLKRQRVTRGSGQKFVNYDMKQHPMDFVLRPKEAARRVAQNLRARGILANGDAIVQDDDHDDDSDDDHDNNALQLNDDDEVSAEENGQSPSNTKTTRPFSGARRSSRTFQQDTGPLYNMKYHPLDELFQAEAAAKVQGTSGLTQTGFNATEPEPADCGVHTQPYEDNERTLISTSQSRKPSSPGGRHSARLCSGSKVPDYDMKHHPMDDHLRPNAMRKRAVARLHPALKHHSPRLLSIATSPKYSAKVSSKSPLNLSLHSSEMSESSINSASPNLQTKNKASQAMYGISKPPGWSLLNNIYAIENPLDWDDLQPIDHLMFLLQRGASAQGNTLPRTWSYVKQALFNEGLLTLDEVNSDEATEWLKARYESVRIGVQLFFKAKPEPTDKKDWSVRYTEGFDVYLSARGSKYWKHQIDSIARPSSTKTDTGPQQGFETENGMESETESLVTEQEHRTNDPRHIKSNSNGVTSVEPHPKSEGLPSSFLEEKECFYDGRITDSEDILMNSMQLHDTAPADYIMSDDEPNETSFSPVLRSLNDQSCQSGIITNIVTNGGTKTRARRSNKQNNPEAVVRVHEDTPDRTPTKAPKNPFSPGSDIPKENFLVSSTDENFSEDEIVTHRTRRSRYHRHNSAFTGPVRAMGSSRVVV